MDLIFKKTTKRPTKIIKILVGILEQSKAAKGAAITPPIANPAIICQLSCKPKRVTKVAAWAAVTKNSAKFTVPIVILGLFPLAKRVVVTIGPQPPPPTASKKPPINPNKERFFCSSLA